MYINYKREAAAWGGPMESTTFFGSFKRNCDGLLKVASFSRRTKQTLGIGRVFFARGKLAQAKNADELFWEEKFHAANGKAQACNQGAFSFFPFKFVGGKDFFIFP
jgi:hypothetical protein